MTPTFRDGSTASTPSPRTADLGRDAPDGGEFRARLRDCAGAATPRAFEEADRAVCPAGGQTLSGSAVLSQTSSGGLGDWAVPVVPGVWRDNGEA